jgi:hypothetical protein
MEVQQLEVPREFLRDSQDASITPEACVPLAWSRVHLEPSTKVLLVYDFALAKKHMDYWRFWNALRRSHVWQIYGILFKLYDYQPEFEELLRTDYWRSIHDRDGEYQPVAMYAIQFDLRNRSMLHGIHNYFDMMPKHTEHTRYFVLDNLWQSSQIEPWPVLVQEQMIEIFKARRLPIGTVRSMKPEESLVHFLYDRVTGRCDIHRGIAPILCDWLQEHMVDSLTTQAGQLGFS